MSADPSTSSSSHLTLNIKTLKGAGFAIRLESSSSVTQLNQRIEAEQNIPIAEQRLIYKGKVLKADKLLSEYGIEEGDAVHLIVKAPAAPSSASDAAQPTPAAAAASTPASGMPNLTPNNVLPNVPATPFFSLPPLGGGAQVLHFNVGPNGQISQSAAGAGQLPPVDPVAEQIMASLFRGLGGAAAPNSNIVIDIQHGQHPPPAAPAAGLGSIPNSAAAAAAAAGAAPSPVPAPGPVPVINVSQSIPGVAIPGASPIPLPLPLPVHPSSHPPLSVNAVRSFLTEVATQIPVLAANPPLSIDARATTFPAAQQRNAFPETVEGFVQLLQQSQAVITQAVPPVMRRVQQELTELVPPLPRQPNLDATAASSSNPNAESVQNRLALQTQLRQLSPALRRIGDSFRGIATLLEAIQVDPQTGDSSLLILPAHLQLGRQVHVVSQSQPLNMGQPSQAFVMQMPAVQLNMSPQSPQPQPVAGAVPSAAGAAPANANPQAPPQPINPLAMIMQQLQGFAQPPAVAAAQPAQAAASPSAPTPAPVAANPAPAPAAANANPNPAPGAGAGAAPQPFNLMSLLGQAAPMIGPLLGNLSNNLANLQHQQHQQGAPGGAHPPADPMANMMQALGPMFANLNGMHAVGPNQPPQQSQPQPQSAAQPHIPIHRAPAPESAPAQAAAPAPASVPAPVSAPAPVSTPAAAAAAPSVVSPSSSQAAAGAQQVPNFGNMIQSFMPMINQMMANPNGASGGAGGASLNSLISGMLGQMGGSGGAGMNFGNDDHADMEDDDHADRDEHDEEEAEQASLFALFGSTAMQHLSLPDLMGLISGDWRGIDRCHEPFRELLLDLMGDDSPQARELLTQSFATGIVEGMLDQEVLADVDSHRIASKDPRTVSYPIVRRHVRALLDLILDTPVEPVVAGAAPTPDAFHVKFKRWGQEFVGEWFVNISLCYDDDFTSASKIASKMVSTKFSSALGNSEMAFMLPMVSGSISSMLMKCAHEFRQRQLLSGEDSADGAAWLDLVPAEQREMWKNTIANDQKLLAERAAQKQQQEGSSSSDKPSLYKPLSYAYLSGSKKGAAAAAAANKKQASPESASSSASSSSSSTAAPASVTDTRISDNLLRTLKRSIALAESNGSNGENVSAQGQALLSQVPDSLQQSYSAQVASDIRSNIQSQFKGDYQSSRYPNIEQQIKPNTGN